MKYVMSDIHGDYKSFYQMLVKINFSSYDMMYILGDVIDKGKENLCLLEFIQDADNICLIKGNHEYLCERYLDGRIQSDLWDACGGINTRREVDVLAEEKKVSLYEFLKGLPIYDIVTVRGESYFLTHSGYDADYDVIHSESGKVDIKESVDRAVRDNQERYLFSNDIHYIPACISFDKKIIVGHYPTLLLAEYNKAEIYHGTNYIDIDTGNERRQEGGRLSCLRLEDKEEFYV